VSIGIAAAFYSAKTLCRIFSQHESDVSGITAENIHFLAKNEFAQLHLVDSKKAYVKYNRGGPAFFVDMVDTLNRRQFVRFITNGFVETNDIDKFLKEFMDEVRKAPQANAQKAKPRSSAKVTPETK